MKYTGTPSRKFVEGFGFVFFDENTPETILAQAKAAGICDIEDTSSETASEEAASDEVVQVETRRKRGDKLVEEIVEQKTEHENGEVQNSEGSGTSRD